MKRKIAIVLALLVVGSLVPAGSVAADEPLRGTMDLQFNLAWPGYQDEIPDWVGNITIDGEEHGMVFFLLGTGKPFDPTHVTGYAGFFGEIWVIYDTPIVLPLDANGDLFLSSFEPPGDILLWGYDTGMTNAITSKYHMSGSVEEALGDLAEAGQNVHMSGGIVWYTTGDYADWPKYAPGDFRLN